MDNPALSQDVLTLLSSLELFGELPEVMTREIAASLEDMVIPEGTVLIQPQGTDDSLYVVISGRLKVSISLRGDEEVLAECGPREIVGETAFLTGHRRSATVSALEATRVLRLSRLSYEQVERTYPDTAARMSRILSRRLRRSQLGIALHRSRLFGALDRPVLHDVETDLELVTLRGGEMLFRQGDPGDALYLVINGRLRVVARQDTGEERVLAELGRGETVGEMAILGGENRSASVYAVRDTNLARLSRENFDRLSAKYPQAIAPMFIRKIIERLQQEISHPSRHAETLNTIAVVPVSESVDLEAFCTRLSAALSRFGRTLHLNGSKLDDLLGKPGASQVTAEHSANSLVVEQLALLEADNRHVIYQTDSGDSAWTRRSVRQADHILLVGRGSADPQPAAIERSVRDTVAESRSTHTSLVLLHENGSRRPSGTRKWLEARRIDRHFHVRLDGEADFERLARVLTGHAVGVVLGGGFARGIAHAGVVRALETAGIPLDFIGGTSMGAIMAAEYAFGLNPDQMLEVTVDVMRTYLRGDLTIPLVAFLKGDQVASLILAVMGGQDVDMEDLWLPCFTISANLTRAKMHVHTTGSVLKSILASGRAPGMYPPVVLNGDLHVDGGIVNNVPADVMKELSKGARVIAINVSPQVDPTMIADYGLGVSGWSVLWGRLNRFAKKRLEVPTLPSILMRTITFGGGSRATGLGAADLYLCPPLETFKINEFHRGPEMADVAYAFALPRVTAWQAEYQKMLVSQG
jgi:CRP-like cAMP-binding protein/predicted acylesterase/phospholipase RssA